MDESSTAHAAIGSVFVVWGDVSELRSALPDSASPGLSGRKAALYESVTYCNCGGKWRNYVSLSVLTWQGEDNLEERRNRERAEAMLLNHWYDLDDG